MKIFFAQFVNGRLGTNKYEENRPFLVLTIILMIISLLLIGMFIYYFIKFLKTPAPAKIIGWPFLIGNWVIQAVTTLCWILALPFYLNAETVFKTPKIALNTEIALEVIGFVSLFSSIFLMWFYLPKFGLGFTNDRLIYIGEQIAYPRFQKIIIDNDRGAIYLNYAQTKRTFKRQKFSLKSVEGQFVLAQAHYSGQQPEVGNEDQYFRSLTQRAPQSFPG